MSDNNRNNDMDIESFVGSYNKNHNSNVPVPRNAQTRNIFDSQTTGNQGVTANFELSESKNNYIHHDGMDKSGE